MPLTRANAKNFNELQDHIHKAEFLKAVDQYVLYKVHMLDNGLKRLFAPKFPWDIRANQPI